MWKCTSNKSILLKPKFSIFIFVMVSGNQPVFTRYCVDFNLLTSDFFVQAFVFWDIFPLPGLMYKCLKSIVSLVILNISIHFIDQFILVLFYTGFIFILVLFFYWFYFFTGFIFLLVLFFTGFIFYWFYFLLVLFFYWFYF